MRHLKNKNYPFWRLDTYFSEYKQRNLKIVKSGGWHFTNIKSPADIYEKLSNFGHHNEFDVSGLTINDIERDIEKRIVNYNHLADQKTIDKYNADYKLKVIDDNLLPEYLVLNKKNLKQWFDFS